MYKLYKVVTVSTAVQSVPNKSPDYMQLEYLDLIRAFISKPFTAFHNNGPFFDPNMNFNRYPLTVFEGENDTTNKQHLRIFHVFWAFIIRHV
jgi:hypothetical protein